ncbi:MAG TPA: riboflavin synthase [Steroidobacteraceae bacterium]|jgi:riboflavin synthase|nr:riboflavin synthase [Steroidobacteraceae bacterium]
MFTGIVQDVGWVQALERRGADLRLAIGTQRLELSRAALGDSISVAGVCLTAVGLAAHRFDVDVSLETLARTTLGGWQVGRRVNLEPALRAGDALGGHLVAGHVDGLAQLVARSAQARSEQLRFRVPHELSAYLARKGSICIDGVSLTVNAVEGADFEVNLIPHTLEVTTLGQLTVGESVNIEVDLIARYVERLMGDSRQLDPR